MALVDRFEIRCDQRWEEMTPRGHGRHCGHCDRTVVDLTRLRRREAQPYLQAKETLCVRVILDDEGEPVFRVDPKRGLGAIALAALAGCTAPAPAPASAPVSVVADQDAAMEPSTIPVGISAEEIDQDTLAASQATPHDEEPSGPARHKIRRFHPVMGRMPAFRGPGF